MLGIGTEASRGTEKSDAGDGRLRGAGPGSGYDSGSGVDVAGVNASRRLLESGGGDCD